MPRVALAGKKYVCAEMLGRLSRDFRIYCLRFSGV